MKWIVEDDITNFDFYGSARDKWDRIVEAGKEEEFEKWLNERFNIDDEELAYVLTQTQLNDYLAFNYVYIFVEVGVPLYEGEEE